MNHTEGIVRISVSLPERLLAQLDRRVDREGYPSRSELLRDLIRGQLVTEKWEGGAEEVIGVLTISYDHHRRELAERVMTIQHERFVNVLCSTHVHLDQHECLEVIILRGRPREVERLSGEIGSLKGVKLARLTRACRVEA
jgi:CopG family nickel-responsive transcriptional regulator